MKRLLSIINRLGKLQDRGVGANKLRASDVQQDMEDVRETGKRRDLLGIGEAHSVRIRVTTCIREYSFIYSRNV